jgi:hypothetical protein
MKPPITVKLNGQGGLSPLTAYDAEQLASAPASAVYDLVHVSKRSTPHHKLYWSVLGKAVKATGKWPTSEHLHQDLKFALGYYQTRASEFGGVMYVPDSIAMYKMTQAEFNVFFEQAMSKLAEAIGIDPLELINAKAEV